jgi:hypothetical protein
MIEQIDKSSGRNRVALWRTFGVLGGGEDLAAAAPAGAPYADGP